MFDGLGLPAHQHSVGRKGGTSFRLPPRALARRANSDRVAPWQKTVGHMRLTLWYFNLWKSIGKPEENRGLTGFHGDLPSGNL